MRLPHHSANELRHRCLRCRVIQKCQQVSERAIPSLLQRIFRDNVANRTKRTEQFNTSEFVLLRRFHLDLLCWHTEGVHQFLARIFGMHPNAIALVFARPIYPNHRDGTDITGIGCLKLPCRFLKDITFRLRLRKGIPPIRIRKIPQVDGEFYHLLFLERDTGNVHEDVADAELRRGRELQHKARIQTVYSRHELLIVLCISTPVCFVRLVQDYRRT